MSGPVYQECPKCGHSSLDDPSECKICLLKLLMLKQEQEKRGWKPFTSWEDLPQQTYLLFKLRDKFPWEYAVGIMARTANKRVFGNIGGLNHDGVDAIAWRVLDLYDEALAGDPS